MMPLVHSVLSLQFASSVRIPDRGIVVLISIVKYNKYGSCEDSKILEEAVFLFIFCK